MLAVRLQRMARARPEYGYLDLSRDARDFAREAAEENVDRAFYLDCLLIAEQDEAYARLHQAADAELEAVSASLAGGCSCRHPNVACGLHVDPIVAGLRELVERAPEEPPPLAFDPEFSW